MKGTDTLWKKRKKKGKKGTATFLNKRENNLAQNVLFKTLLLVLKGK